ncbi:MAG: hypothetical protein J2P49_00015 [Methylocapsa sp.]|nr:hypothetical protein [Methylocapsa sp.]
MFRRETRLLRNGLAGLAGMNVIPFPPVLDWEGTMATGLSGKKQGDPAEALCGRRASLRSMV